MSTNQALISQLTGTDCLIYLAMDPVDTFKSVAMYRNLQGDNGVLNAAQLGALNLTFADLPVIVKATELADAMQEGDPRMRKLTNYTFSIENSSTVANISEAACDYDQEKVFTEVDARIAASISSVYKPKGSVESVADLPVEGNTIGDVYSVRNENGAEYAWVERNGEQVWDPIGAITDLSEYYKKTDVDGMVSSVSDAIAALENATETKLTAEEAARIQAVNAVDGKISFAELINRIWIYGENVFDLNLMVKPGMYYCSSDASVVGNAMTNMPDGTAEGCLLVLKNSQIFWEGGTNKGRTYYRYQTGAGPSVSEYTEAWNAGAMLSDVKELKEYFIGLNKLQAGVNESHNESIRTLTEAHYDLEEKVDHLDYTAFEVYPTDAPIAAGTIDEVTGLTYKYEVPAEMTARFIIRTSCPVSESDVTIAWGDGEYTNIKDVPSSNTLADGNELEVMVSHTYTESKRFIVKFFGKQYFGFQKVNKVQDTFGFGSNVKSIVSRILAADLPLASHISCLCYIGAFTDRMLMVDVPTYMITQGMWNLSGMFYENSNLVKATGLRYFQGDIRSVNSFFSKCLSLAETDFIFPAYVRDNGGLASVFNQCPSLVLDIGKVFSDQGFIGTSYITNYIFAGCASMTGIVPASKLWENGNIAWTKPADAFKGCPAEIRSQVPTSWGGTNTEIEAKLQSGYWNRLHKKDLAALESEVSGVKDMINDLSSNHHVFFIENGTEETPEEVTLTAGKIYVATKPFNGTLPENPTHGTVIDLGVERGSINMQVIALNGATISGTAEPVKVGLTPDGSVINNIVYKFVYNGATNNWIVL